MEEPVNEQPNAPLSPVPGAPTPVFQVWMNALTKPSEQTFAEMAASPQAKATTGLLWVFLGSLANFFLTSLVQGTVMRQMMQQYGDGQFPLNEIAYATIASELPGGHSTLRSTTTRSNTSIWSPTSSSRFSWAKSRVAPMVAAEMSVLIAVRRCSSASGRL